VPNACLKMEKTIMILVKEVSMIRIAGAKERIVSKIKIFRLLLMSSGPFGTLRLILRPGVASFAKT